MLYGSTKIWEYYIVNKVMKVAETGLTEREMLERSALQKPWVKKEEIIRVRKTKSYDTSKTQSRADQATDGRKEWEEFLA